MNSLEQLRIYAQRNDHCRLSSVRHIKHHPKPTGRIALRFTYRLFLHKESVEKNRRNKSVENRFRYHQAGRNNQRLHHETGL